MVAWLGGHAGGGRSLTRFGVVPIMGRVPLPTDPNTSWPPSDWAPFQRDIQESAAWYAGDESALAGFYGGVSNPQARRQRFWSRGNRNAQGQTDRQRLHIPVAADVAATSADLLFGDGVAFTIPGASGDTIDQGALKAEQRLTEILTEDGADAALLEAAELAAALGGVYLRPAWDDTVADRPMLTTVQPDNAVPEFQWGRLSAVTFWQIVSQADGKIVRHLERHEPGRILHALYRGNVVQLGRRVKLASVEQFAHLAVDDEGAIALPAAITGLDVRYVPNVRPNRKHRTKPIGRSDYAGTEPLMDALDETWSSWMRDIRLGKARIIVPAEYLERKERGAGATFDTDAEVFAPLQIDPTSADAGTITLSQFDLRTAEHAETALALFTQIVVSSGYSPQSFGLQGDGAAQTATEVDARESKSDRTVSRKRRYWTKALEDVGEMLLILDREHFGGGEPYRPRIEWPADAEDDIRDVATALNLLNLAKAASADTRVRMVHPEWTDKEVADEVALILAEDGVPVADPTGMG